MRQKLGLLAWTALVGTLAGAQPTPALAQSSSSARGAEVEEVVVTARKTAEKLQDTPVAVTAVTTAQLAENQVRSAIDLQRIAPSLQYGFTGGPGGPGLLSWAMRGQVNQDPNSSSDAPVATYIDGVNLPRSTSANFTFFDLAQVEVLRGPQGTLFGRNTTGGALNITSNGPSDKFGGYLTVGGGNFKRRMVEGAVDIPILGSELGLRLAGRAESHDGYYDNPFYSNFGDMDGSGLRGTLRWAPSNLPLTVTVRADRSSWKDHGFQNAVIAINPAGTVFPQFAALGLNPNSFLVGSGGTARYDQTFVNPRTGQPLIDGPRDQGVQAGLSGTLDFDFGSWQLKSITAWRKADSTNAQDHDGTPVKGTEFASFYREDMKSQEVQANTTVGKLDLIGGFFYFEEYGTERSDALISGVLTFRDNGSFKGKSRAVYGQANYHFTDRLRATAGYRYTWDSRSIVRHPEAPFGVCRLIPAVPFSQCTQPLAADFEYPSWTIGLDYKVSDNVFTYIKSSRASRAGGFNPREAPVGQEAYRPEELTDVEAGLKADLLNRRLRTNIAVFASKNKDVQRSITGLIGTPARVTQYTTNAGNLKSTGVEVEVTALPWEGMEVRTAASYIDARYESGTYLDPRRMLGVPAPAPLVNVDRSGEPAAQTPEWQFNIGATQEFSFEAGVARFHLDYVYFDNREFPLTATPGATAADIAQLDLQRQIASLDSYGLVNGRASFTFTNGVEAALWVRNLFDKDYYTGTVGTYSSRGNTSSGVETAAGIVTKNQGTPRTVGIDLSYRF